jgi:molecular chaperone DnaK (HSP70)
MTYAIDFGTSNTVVTRWNAATGQAETLALPGISQRLGANPPLIPSLLYVEDARSGQVLVGQQVRDRGLDADARCFRNFKRGLGANLKGPGFLPELDGQKLSFEQIGEWFLTQVIRDFAASEPGMLESLTLTVPVDSFEAYRLWLGRVASELNIQQVRLIDESTAAALGYGLTAQQLLLVVDFGGGTLDLSLVRLDSGSIAQSGSQSGAQSGASPLGFLLKFGKNSFAEPTPGKGQKPQLARVLAKAGQNLGGADIDNWIADYFAQTQNLAITPLTLRLAERLKIQLSSAPQAQEVYFDEVNFESYDLTLDRAQLGQILQGHQFFERLDGALQQVQQQAQRQGIELADIDAVLMVGGSCQIGAVQDWIKQTFDPAKIRADRPFEAIAQGALQLGRGLEIKDFLYHGYGIRYWDQRTSSHRWHPLVAAGQPYPMNQPVELRLGASLANQPSIELLIGELGADRAQTEVYFDGDRLITRRLDAAPIQVQPLNDQAQGIAVLDPPGMPGADRVKLQFWVDAQRFLKVTAEDLLTRRILVEDEVVAQLR